VSCDPLCWKVHVIKDQIKTSNSRENYGINILFRENRVIEAIHAIQIQIIINFCMQIPL